MASCFTSTGSSKGGGADAAETEAAVSGVSPRGAVRAAARVEPPSRHEEPVPERREVPTSILGVAKAGMGGGGLSEGCGGERG